jgi:hypothetical protein
MVAGEPLERFEIIGPSHHIDPITALQDRVKKIAALEKRQLRNFRSFVHQDVESEVH